MIEWRWGLRPLSPRDASAKNLAEELDFSKRNDFAPQFSVPQAPFGTACLSSGASAAVVPDQWVEFKVMAETYGW